MAYTYRRYTETTSDSIYVTYKCTKCGQINTFIHTMTSSVSYDDRTFTQRGFVQHQINARDTLKDEMDVKMGTALLDAADGDYTTMNLSHRCPNCGHREPWASPTPKIVLFATILCAIIGVIGTLPMINGAATPLNIALCACGWGLAVILGLVYLIRPIVLCMKTENLPEIARPVFTGKKEDTLKAISYLEKLSSKQ